MTGRAITIAVALIGSASSANAQDSTLAGGRLEIAGQAPNACVIRRQPAAAASTRCSNPRAKRPAE
jgi:hypothetical protein